MTIVMVEKLLLSNRLDSHILRIVYLLIFQDVRRFYDEVPNKAGLFDVGNSFSHFDFIWGINATEFVYVKIIEIFK